jgi:hypothetical protein
LRPAYQGPGVPDRGGGPPSRPQLRPHEKGNRPALAESPAAGPQLDRSSAAGPSFFKKSQRAMLVGGDEGGGCRMVVGGRRWRCCCMQRSSEDGDCGCCMQRASVRADVRGADDPRFKASPH